MIRRGAAQDLAVVDRAIELARAATDRKLERLRKHGPRKRRPYISRGERLARMHFEQSQRAERRGRMADTPLLVPVTQDGQAIVEQLYDSALAKLEREPSHAMVRAMLARTVRRLARILPADGVPGTRGAWLTRAAAQITADRLEKARPGGYYAQHVETGALHFRWFSRSGQRLLDPSEARRDTARTLRRLMPAIRAQLALGHQAYFVVFTLPNVGAGELAVQKELILRKFQRDILGRGMNGAIARQPFLEILGSYVCQEDPLTAHGAWHPHLNAVLIVDPKLCRREGVPLLPQPELPMRGHAIVKVPERPPPPDRAPPGTLSYRKIRNAWGPQYQVEIQPIRGGSDDAIERALREVVKYCVKWVSAKSIDAGASARAAAGPDTADRLATRIPAIESADHGPGVEGGAAPARARDDGRLESDLHGPGAGDRRAPRPAPALVDWPLERVAEWLIANKRFRRVRTSGVLYPLPPDDLPPDPEKAGLLRFLGRFWISPRGVTLQAPKLHYIGSIHGDKSDAIFGRSPGVQARAGPIPAPGAA